MRGESCGIRRSGPGRGRAAMVGGFSSTTATSHGGDAMSGGGSGGAEEEREEEAVYDFVTFGAPSAHVLKFKGGGVRRRRRVVRELRCGDFDEERFLEEDASPRLLRSDLALVHQSPIANRMRLPPAAAVAAAVARTIQRAV